MNPAIRQKDCQKNILNILILVSLEICEYFKNKIKRNIDSISVLRSLNSDQIFSE